MKNKILVIGANGIIGSEVVKVLKENGADLKLTTSKQPTSDEYVQVNLATGEGLKEAFNDVDSAFLITPAGYADQSSVLLPLIEQAKSSGVRKVVLMTAMGANLDDSTPFRKSELALIHSGVDYNIVRPNWFLQNFNTFWIHDILSQHQINLPAGEAKVSFVDTRDVSEVIAKLLISNEFNNQEFDLTGPIAVDHHQVAQAINEVTHSQITYMDIAPETLEKSLIEVGLPKDYVAFLLVIFSFLKAGYSSGVTHNIEKILGRAPRGLEQYVSDYKTAWETLP